MKKVFKGIQKKAIDESAENEGKKTGGRQTSCEAGVARRLKMKKRRKAGKKGTKWQSSGRWSANCRESWQRRRIEGSSLIFWMPCKKKT